MDRQCTIRSSRKRIWCQVSVASALLLASSCSSQQPGPQSLDQTSTPSSPEVVTTAQSSNASPSSASPNNAPPSSSRVEAISIDIPESKSVGGLIAADLDGDGRREIVVTRAGFIAAYSLAEGLLWERNSDLRISRKAEQDGVPGLHGPGIQVADFDDDGASEVLYLTNDNRLEAISGSSGKLKHSIDLPAVDAHANRWEHGIVANFSGEGDNEILLQASQPTDKDSYIRDNVQAAFAFSELLSKGSEAEPLWQTDNFVSLSHGSAKVFDLNQDGRDEVVGATILSSTGETLYQAEIGNTSFPHIDSIAVDDIDPQRPGLEVVIPEESGRERVILFDEKGEIWSDRHRRQSDDSDGDKVSIGNFDPDSAGLEMWFRGNESAHFTVLSAEGQKVSDYRFADIRPKTWTRKGFEVINRIRWTGEDKDYIVAKERHEAGDVGIFDALNGQQIAQFPAQTERLYVADVLGDWREEIIVLESDKLKVIENTVPNPSPDRPRLWEQPHYQRQKMTWNYYSP